MRLTLGTGLIFACLVTAPADAGQAPATADERRVVVRFDEQQLTDAQRAQLYTVIARSVPERDWPTLKLDRPTDMPSLLNNYFDVFQRGPGRAPNTYDRLAELIVEANKATEPGRKGVLVDDIKVPPVPVRAHSTYGNLEVASRRFDPETMLYERVVVSGRVDKVDKDPLAEVEKKSDPRQSGRTTEATLTLTAEAKAILDAISPTVPLVVVDAAERDAPASEAGFAQVTFLSAQPVACLPAAEWIARSPYATALREALAGIDVATLSGAASNVPLKIIDWNVTDPKGHGARVRAVVLDVLADLGLQSLEVGVQHIELNPVHNRADLGQMLGAYKTHLTKTQPDLSSSFVNAEEWIAHHQPKDPYAANQKIPSLVLQAVFWTEFRKTQVLNFSFRTDSAALTVFDAGFMQSAKAFAAIAAGNDGVPTPPKFKPQAEALQWPNVVNVTHGRPDGSIQGDITNHRFNVFVDVVAPGCGYATAPLTRDESGSSFASPFVATFAWLRLLRGSAIGELKSRLINAGHPLPAIGQHVQSGGLFDPAMFVLDRASHFVNQDGTLVALTQLIFDLTYHTDDGDSTVRSDALDQPKHVASFYRCASSPAVCTTVRRKLKSGRILVEADEVHTVHFAAAADKQRFVPVQDAENFLKLVRTIVF